MHLHGWTHAVLDENTGAPIGVSKDIDDLEDWGLMGVTLYFDGGEVSPPQYTWLHGMTVLPLDQIDANVRSEIALMLTFVPA